MSERSALVVPALETAVAELEPRRARFEVYARLGESLEVRFTGAGWERRRSRQVGVACRVWDGSGHGFAAAAGSAAAAGRDAARSALASLIPGDDPLPPRDALGRTSVPPVPPAAGIDAVEAFARTLAARLARGTAALSVAEIRVLAGGSTSFLVTGDGYAGRGEARAVAAEVLAAPRRGAHRLVHAAAPSLADLDPAALSDRVAEEVSLAPEGGPPRRRLADVLLAPAVAAPVLLALVERLHADPPQRGHASPEWCLVDERAGPGGLMPAPFDGEGIAGRRIELVGGGRVRERLATWREASRAGAPAGGAVRPSFADPPRSAPANLMVVAVAPTPASQLLERMEEGFFLVLPVGPPRLEPERDVVVMPACGVAVRRGTTAERHPVVELRASPRRLLTALEAVGDDPRSFSLAAAVTTPSLLLRRVEVA